MTFASCADQDCTVCLPHGHGDLFVLCQIGGALTIVPLTSIHSFYFKLAAPEMMTPVLKHNIFYVHRTSSVPWVDQG